MARRRHYHHHTPDITEIESAVHNDTNKLNFPARMNKIADELARDHCGAMKAPQTKVTEKFCLLRIDKRYITRDLQK
jgi:hypothetical protein